MIAENSKSEVRSSKQIRMIESQNSEYQPLRLAPNIRISNFELVSDFDIRISNFLS